MNITESNQLNTVLAWVLGRQARPERWGPLRPITAEVAREAAACLADRAQRALGAGLGAATVRDNWPSTSPTTRPGEGFAQAVTKALCTLESDDEDDMRVEDPMVRYLVQDVEARALTDSVTARRVTGAVLDELLRLGLLRAPVCAVCRAPDPDGPATAGGVWCQACADEARDQAGAGE